MSGVSNGGTMRSEVDLPVRAGERSGGRERPATSFQSELRQQLEYQPNAKTWRCVDCNTIWDSPSYYDDADFDRVGNGCGKCVGLFESEEVEV